MSTYTDLLDDIEPKLSDNYIITSVIEKHRVAKRKKIRNLSISVFVLTILATMTLTVGAVNDWDYNRLLQRVFNGNQIVGDSIEKEISYRIVNNTYDGFTFKLSGLYADDESLFLIIEITSEKPVFNESYEARGSLLSTLALVSDSTGSETAQVTDFTMNDFHYYIIDETRMVVVNFFAEPSLTLNPAPDELTSNTYPYHEAVANGREFTLIFGDASHTDLFSSTYTGLPLKGGGAEVRFTIDAFNEQNVLMMYPDISLENGDVLKEIRLTPFSIIVRFDGVAQNILAYTDDYGWVTEISILMNDGTQKSLEMLNNDGGLLRSLSGGYHADSENHSWIASFHHNRLLDLDEVAAVVIYKIEIPVNRIR